MIRVVIIEDEAEQVAKLQNFLERFIKENKEQFQTVFFDAAEPFLNNYYPCDIIFVDINLPGMTGMELAKWLRERDEVVTLVFITSLAQYALEGYKVDALDFILKPVNYYTFSSMMLKAVRRVKKSRGKEVVLHTMSGIQRINSAQVYYVEVERHHLLYHTEDGVIDVWGSLSEAEKILPQDCFVRCNSCYLVNLKYASAIENGMVVVGEDRLAISRAKKKEFMQRMSSYWGG